MCGSRSKCKITGGFYHCEYLCEDVTEQCVSADSTTAASDSTTEAATTPTTALVCKMENEACAPADTSGPNACCTGLTCGPDPTDGTRNICKA